MELVEDMISPSVTSLTHCPVWLIVLISTTRLDYYDLILGLIGMKSISGTLRRVYGSCLEALLERLKTPPRRLYARVNTIKCTRKEVIEFLRKEGFDAYPDEEIPDAIYFAVEGPFVIECKSDKKVVVDLKTANSLLLGSNLYRPGIVKMPRFNRDEYLLAVTPRGTPVSCLKTVMSSAEARTISRGLVAVNVSSPYRAPRIGESKTLARGLIYPQSAPSMITSHVVQPEQGMLVVDLNAAPGGKTGHIVQLTHGKSRIVAFDRSERKVALLKNTLDRLGLNINVLGIPADSRYAWIDLKLENKADRVLIDPPCSNLGVRPVMDYERTLRDIRDLSNYQKQFLRAASRILKNGGLLVYSTCTLTLEENEENIRYAIEELGFSVFEPSMPVPHADKVKFKGVVGYRFSPLRDDMPGYFIAVLTK